MNFRRLTKTLLSFRQSQSSPTESDGVPQTQARLKVSKKILANGQTYEGQWQSNLRHSQGKYTWLNGRTYEGQWQSGQIHGQGKSTWPNGRTYEGQWQSGQMHGQGKSTWPNGDTYDGQWQSGQIHGQGKSTWPNGRTYEGQWQSGQIHGQGKYTWPNGDTYEGQWQSGQIHGQGKYTWLNGRTYEGQWQSGQIHGQGKSTWPNGDTYEGQWQSGQMHGQGKYTWPNGDTYEGQWQSNLKHGQGKYTTASGFSFVGEWHQCTFVRQLAKHTPLETVAIDAEFARKMEDLGAAGSDVTTWIRREGRDIFVLHPASPGPTQVGQSCLYEAIQVPLQERVRRLAELRQDRRELVAIQPGSGDNLVLLMRVNVNTQSDETFDYVGHVLPTFEPTMLNNRGAIVAYTLLPPKDANLAPMHYFVTDAARRATHRVETVLAVDALQPLANALGADGWRLCASTLGANPQAIFRRLVVAPPRRAVTPAKLAQSRTADRARQLIRCGEPQAAAALECLGPAAAALANILRQHATQPWQAYCALAQAAQATEVNPQLPCQLADIAAGLSALMARDVAKGRLSQILTVADATALSPSVQRFLNDAMLTACGVPLDTGHSLAAAVAAQAVEAVAFLIALGVENAIESSHGHPVIAAILAGHQAALQEWERMGPRQRAALHWASRQAAELSAAATPLLTARWTALGLPPETLEQMRRHVQQAAICINFKSTDENSLLRSDSYVPQPEKRALWEIIRFEGHYTEGTAPREEHPKYGWLNIQKSRLGFSKFGDAIMVLRPEVALRISIVNRCQGAYGARIGTLQAFDHVLLGLSDVNLRQLDAASRGVRRERPGTVGDAETSDNPAQDILELHVHGPVQLSRDVRKIIGTTPSLRTAAAGLEAMANRLGVPLRWRLSTAYNSAQRDDYINALNQARLDVAAWSSAGDKDLITLQPARTAVQTNYYYAIHQDHVARLREMIGQLARESLEVVGLHLEAPTLMRNAPQPVATVLTRQNPLQQISHSLDLRSTYLPLERLEQLEQAGNEVVAYAQVLSSFAPTPQHLFVIQAASKSPYTHLMRSCAHDGVDNERAHWAEQGWSLCGQTSVDGKTYTLIFKRPGLKAPGPAADDSDAVTLRGESISTVPEPLRFTTDSGQVFDIDELVEFCLEKGALKNPFTNGPLTSTDIDRLVQHPSQAGLVLVASLEAERAQQSHQATPR